MTDDPTELDLVYEDLHKAQQRIAELEDTIMLSQKLTALLQVRIAKLEKCVFEGLTVTTSEELDAWFKEAEALSEARTK